MALPLLFIETSTNVIYLGFVLFLKLLIFIIIIKTRMLHDSDFDFVHFLVFLQITMMKCDTTGKWDFSMSAPAPPQLLPPDATEGQE